jgi:uncharacterized protein (DUF488 family)
MNTAVRKTRLFTIGHSDRTLEEFLVLLEKSSVRLVADVRSNPTSARFPWFERAALASELEKRGLVYRWFRDLGGRRPATPGEEEHTALADEGMRRYAAAMSTPEFAAAAADLLGLAASAVVAILCAEADHRQCHRRLLADRLHMMGAEVVHILGPDDSEAHEMHPDLVVEGGRLVYRTRQLSMI